MRGKNDTNYRGFFSALVYNPVYAERSGDCAGVDGDYFCVCQSHARGKASGRRYLAIPPLSARYCPPDSHRDGIHPGTPTRRFGIPGYRPLAKARCGVFQTLLPPLCFWQTL